MIGTAWMDAAACTPDPAWTADRQPDQVTLDRLKAICVTCPVLAACATYALESRCETGMYAGVWIPSAGQFWASRPTNVSWVHARRLLQRRADAGLVTT